MTALATALDALGWTTTVPDLRAASDSPRQFELGAVAAAVGATDVVIGHSGAGAVIPGVAEATGAGLVFVDAVVPPPGPRYRTSVQVLQLLDTLPVVDGLLPPWHEWWPAELLAELVPDEVIRRTITAEIPRLARAFYDVELALPPSWWTRPAAYLQLSPSYDDDRARAERWGWPISQLEGRHLDLCVHPGLVAEHVAQLVHRLAEAAG